MTNKIRPLNHGARILYVYLNLVFPFWKWSIEDTVFYVNEYAGLVSADLLGIVSQIIVREATCSDVEYM